MARLWLLWVVYFCFVLNVLWSTWTLVLFVFNVMVDLWWTCAMPAIVVR